MLIGAVVVTYSEVLGLSIMLGIIYYSTYILRKVCALFDWKLLGSAWMVTKEKYEKNLESDSEEKINMNDTFKENYSKYRKMLSNPNNL